MRGAKKFTPPVESGVLRVEPNPFVGMVTCSVALRRATNVELDVFDISGRQVRRVFRGAMLAGIQRVNWDGRDGTGKLVPPSIYLLRARMGDRVVTAKLVSLR